MRPQRPAEGHQGWLTRYLVVGILALGCGFLSFNMQHILKLTHIHISLAHSHKMQSFCAFIGCKLTEELQGARTVIIMMIWDF